MAKPADVFFFLDAERKESRKAPDVECILLF